MKLAEVLELSRDAEDLSTVYVKTLKADKVTDPDLHTALSWCATAAENAEQFIEKTNERDKERHLTNADVTLDYFSPKHQDRVHALPKKYSSIWDGFLGAVNTTYYFNDLVRDAKPFHAQWYRAHQNNEQLLKRRLTVCSVKASFRQHRPRGPHCWSLH